MKRLALPLIGFCSFLSSSPTVFSQKVWIGGDGNGGDGIWQGTNFSPTGAPASGDVVQIFLSDSYDSQTSDIRIQSVVNSSTMRVGRGKEASITLASGATWTAGGIVSGDKNPVAQTGTGATHVTLTAESGAGVFRVTQFVVGLDDVFPAVTGHSMTFTGEHLRVTVNVANTSSIVGRSNGGSRMYVEDQADVTLSALERVVTRID